MTPEEIKDLVVQNQELIDKLNEELSRKTQEISIIQEISVEINTSLNLNVVLKNMLDALDRVFGFNHSMILLLEENGEELSVAASFGYEQKGIGAKVKVGNGTIGVVAKKKRLMRIGNIGAQMAYMNAVKTQMEREDDAIKLPGLEGVQSQVAIPLLSNESLIGVLSVESTRPNLFNKKDELIIGILANQAASAIEKARAHENLKALNESLEEKVRERTREVVEQRDLVNEKNKEIVSSIQYAKRFQEVMFPHKEYVDKHLGESFQFFKPKDIVSGDIYWVNNKKGKTFFAAIDCTGHGVPGAFVSIVAHSNFQRALLVFKESKPSKILDIVNETVTNAFNRDNNGVVKDGMDVALCALNDERTILEFSGANNPVYIVRKGTVEVIRGDRQAIGYSENPQPFTNHTLPVQKGDCIYVFSDGFADQFGGAKNRKFGYKKFRDLLLSISHLPMKEQEGILGSTFSDWIAEGTDEQIDDVCIVGVRV